MGYAITKDQAYNFEDFVSYHVAKGSKFKNWAMAYKTWLSNSTKFGGSTKDPRPVKAQNGKTVYMDWTGTKVALEDFSVRKIIKQSFTDTEKLETANPAPAAQRDLGAILQKALGGER